MRLLLENGADLNVLNEKGIGPLYMAIKGKSYSCIKFLVRNNA